VSPAAKLLGFAAVLAVVFGVAALAGAAAGPDRTTTDEPAGGHGGGEEEHGAAPDPVRGLAVAENGLRLELESTELPRNRATELRFAITGEDGRPVSEFDVEHEKRMHLILVRRDGAGFQHLHPEMDAAGTWHTNVTLPDAGAYRVFADFSHDGTAQTLAADLAVDGAAEYRPLPDPSDTAETADGYEVTLDAHDGELAFTVTRDGRPVETEPYLGARGHLVALREGDLAYLHVHPEENAVQFMTEFPSSGRYRLYLQFQHAGRVHTAEFTHEVPR
jgi:hypothetical protein